MGSDFVRPSQRQLGIFRGVAKNETEFFLSLHIPTAWCRSTLLCYDRQHGDRLFRSDAGLVERLENLGGGRVKETEKRMVDLSVR